MPIETVKELLIDHLRDLYDAEKQLVKTLPKLAKNANSEELKEAIEHHLQETEGHVARLEQVFEQLDTPAKSKPCKGMRGLIEEGKEVMGEDANDACADLGMIAAAQKVEHYEISAYGTAKALAEKLGENDIVELLDETLNEEKAADEKLTEVAEGVMEQASSEAEASEDEEEMATVGAGGRSGSRSAPKSRSGSRSNSGNHRKR